MSGRRILNGSCTEDILGQRPLTLLNETHHLTRRRIYSIRTMEDVVSLIESLKRERFMGRVKFNCGPGGTVMDVELEESAKLKNQPD